MTSAQTQPAVDALLAARLRNAQPALWTNAAREVQPAAALPAPGRTISVDDTHAAAARLARFAGLLAQVFPGYSVTFTGSLVGAAELFALVFAFCVVFARIYNAIVDLRQGAVISARPGARRP